jgi:diguanylate cyclase (GGDEF)-like protein
VKRPVDAAVGSPARRGGRSRRPAILAALLALAALPAAAHRLNFQLYSDVQGFPQHQILALLQDATGYLWFGSYAGLSRYDGHGVRTYTTADGLAANAVTELAEDRQGRLWAATRGGHVCVLEGAAFRCLAMAASSGAEVSDLEADRDGGLWVATSQGLILVAGRATLRFTTAEGLPSDACLRVLQDQQGTLWVGTTAGLARRDGDRFVAVLPGRLGGRRAQPLAATGDGLVVGVEGELFRLRGETLRPIPLPGSERPVFTDAAVDGEGALWVASKDGAFWLAGGLALHVTPELGLPTESLHRVLVDREGEVWFGSDMGAAKLVPSPFQAFTANDGLPSSVVHSLAEGPRGELWVGTHGGIAVRGEGRMRRFGVPAGGFEGHVFGLAPAPGGAGMLIGTDAGLVLWDGGVRRVYRVADGLPGERIGCLLADPAGGVWIGTEAGLARLEGGRIRTFPEQPSLHGSFIVSLGLDGRGRLWIGLISGGVLVFDGRSVTRLGAREGLTDQAIWSLARDGEGRMWLGSNGDGAFRVDGEKIERFAPRQGLIDGFVWQVLCDRAGSVWLYTGQGLDRFDGARFRHYGRGDGLVDLEGSAGAALESADGDLWFGTSSGLMRFVPGSDKHNTLPPPVVVERVAARTQRLAPGSAVAFDSGPMGFDFAALSFRDEAAVRYRHRLVGLSPEWSPPVKEHRVSYASLGPGLYSFEVEAANEDGVWSARPAAFAFTVRPALWQTWWFRAALLLALAAGVACVWHLRVRSIQARRRYLEELVAERTAELESKNVLLAELATTDALTGLANRRHFSETLDLELRKLSRGPAGSRMSLVLLDVDHFKQLNDRFGHPAGDRLLRTLAQRLRAAVRSTDLVARVGGEEFAILLAATGLDGAAVSAGKLLEAVRARPFALGDQAIAVTVSLGVAEAEEAGFTPEGAAEDLLRRADSALYAAKWQGRDRVVVEQGSPVVYFHGAGGAAAPMVLQRRRLVGREVASA